MEIAGRGEPARRRILGVEADLDGVSDRSPGHGLVDLVGQGRTTGHEELQSDEVQPGHPLGHRVLDLETGVHLEEVGLAAGEGSVGGVRTTGVEDELDGARVDVAHGPGGGHRRIGQTGSEFGSDHR